MTEVNDVILARQGGSDAFSRMVGWSLLLHALLVLPVVLGIVELGGETVEPPRTVMTISLSGATGPRTGTTPMAGREVPPPPPQPAPPRPTPVPARPQPTVTTQPQQTRPRPQPAPQEAPQPGATRTETGARGRGFGLATGGGGGTGVQLDVSNFCCPDYIQQMITLIQQNWIQNHGLAGSTRTRFTITRNGTIEQAQVLLSSGFQVLDDAAIRALLRTRLPELPPQYTNATLGVQVTFQYER